MAEIPFLSEEDQKQQFFIPLTSTNEKPVTIPREKDLNNRSMRYDFALGEQSPGVMSIGQSIKDGQESVLRKTYAAREKLETERIRLDVLNNWIKERKGPISKEELDIISNASREELLSDPDTIFERGFGRKLIDTVVARSKPNSPINPNQIKTQEEYNKYLDELDVASDVFARQEKERSKYEELQAEWEERGLVRKGTAFLGQITPLLSAYRTRNVAIPGDLLPGENLDQQVSYLRSLPLSQYSKKLDEVIDSLKEANILDAMAFLDYMREGTTSDKFINNLFGVLDVVDVASLGAFGASKLALKGSTALTSLDASKKALASFTARFSKDRVPTLVGAAEAMGDVPSAAMGQILERAKLAKVGSNDPDAIYENMIRRLPTFMRPNIIDVERGSLSAAQANALEQRLEKGAKVLIDATNSIVRVDRLEEGSPEWTAAYVQALEGFKREANVNDAILDIGHLRTDANTYSIDIKVGRRDGTLFDTPTEALETGIREYGFNSQEFIIKQQGDGHYLSFYRPFDETTPEVIRSIELNPERVTPQGWWNTFTGWWRTPNETTSKSTTMDRKTITHGVQKIHAAIREVSAPIESLPKKKWKEVEQVIDWERDFIREGNSEFDQAKRGIVSRTPREFEERFKEVTGSFPTEEQINAYFAARQLNDYDHFLRNLGIYRDKARLGLMQVETTFSLNGKKFPINFEGREIKELPFGSRDDFSLLLIDDLAPEGRILLDKKTLTSTDKETIDTALKERGFRIFQVLNDPRFKGDMRKYFGEEAIAKDIHYIVAPSASKKSLKSNQLPYQEGWHVFYPQKWFLKQPQFMDDGGTLRYKGDVSLAVQETEAEAKKFAKAFDDGRKILKGELQGDLTDHLAKTGLPYSTARFKALFEGTDDGRKAMLDINHPISYTHSGKNVLDTHADIAKSYPGLINDVRNEHNLFQNIDKKYVGERNPDLPTYLYNGDEMSPLIEHWKPRKINGSKILLNALSNTSRALFTADYKYKVIDDFISQFGHLLQVTPEELRADPVFFLHNPVWKENYPDRQALAAAKNHQRAAVLFLGSEGELSKNLNWAQEKLMSSIYNVAGQKTSNWVAEHLLPIETDPFKFFRNFAFHTKLGFFNPVQMFVQAQGFTHILALAPQHALNAAGFATYARMRGINNRPSVVGKMAEQFGEGKVFEESYEAFKRTGLYQVEGDVAVRNDLWEPNLFQSTAGKFLDAGTFFFKETERFVRLSSWHAAYLEWKKMNPGKIAKDGDIRQILARQEIMSLDMTAASSAAWQKGLLSIPTQFLGYQIRLMEQMTGGRLTKMEKARVFATYSAMYGLPVGMTSAVGIWPLYESFRQAALQQGYDVESPGVKAFLEGIPNTILGMITQKTYNVAERYGPNGLSIIRDAIDGEKSFLEIIAGPGGNIFADFAKSLYPGYHFLANIFSDESEQLKLTAEDWIEATRVISTVNNAHKMFYGLNTGKWLTKNGAAITDVTPFDAVFNAVTGLSPIEISDTFRMMDSLKDVKAAQSEMEKAVIENYRKGMRAQADGEVELAQKYFKNAKVYIKMGGFDPQQENRIFRRAIFGMDAMAEKINEQFKKEILEKGKIQ